MISVRPTLGPGWQTSQHSCCNQHCVVWGLGKAGPLNFLIDCFSSHHWLHRMVPCVHEPMGHLLILGFSSSPTRLGGAMVLMLPQALMSLSGDCVDYPGLGHVTYLSCSRCHHLEYWKWDFVCVNTALWGYFKIPWRNPGFPHFAMTWSSREKASLAMPAWLFTSVIQPWADCFSWVLEGAHPLSIVAKADRFS